MKASPVKSVLRRRLKPYQVALCVLLAGWVPSLLLAYYYSATLSRTLEAKQVDDAESLVGSLARHVENELARTGETLDYYRTLPITAALLAPAPAAGSGTPRRPGHAAAPAPGTPPIHPPPAHRRRLAPAPAARRAGVAGRGVLPAGQAH